MTSNLMRLGASLLNSVHIILSKRKGIFALNNSELNHLYRCCKERFTGTWELETSRCQTKFELEKFEVSSSKSAILRNDFQWLLWAQLMVKSPELIKWSYPFEYLRLYNLILSFKQSTFKQFILPWSSDRY